MFKLFSIIGQGIIWIATHPKVRKMIWGWAVDGYKFTKGKLKKKDVNYKRDSKTKRTATGNGSGNDNS